MGNIYSKFINYIGMEYRTYTIGKYVPKICNVKSVILVFNYIVFCAIHMGVVK